MVWRVQSSREIEESFCPSDLAERQEQSKRMQKEHAALEFNYHEMQKKALKADSIKERTDKISALVQAAVNQHTTRFFSFCFDVV